MSAGLADRRPCSFTRSKTSIMSSCSSPNYVAVRLLPTEAWSLPLVGVSDKVWKEDMLDVIWSAIVRQLVKRNDWDQDHPISKILGWAGRMGI